MASSHNGVFVVGSYEGQKANPVCMRFKPDRLWRENQVLEHNVYSSKLLYIQYDASGSVDVS